MPGQIGAHDGLEGRGPEPVDDTLTGDVHEDDPEGVSAGADEEASGEDGDDLGKG